MEVTKRLFIGGLFHGATEKDLREKFSRYGAIDSVEIKRKGDADGKDLKVKKRK